jgi:hypothetical protein
MRAAGPKGHTPRAEPGRAVGVKSARRDALVSPSRGRDVLWGVGRYLGGSAAAAGEARTGPRGRSTRAAAGRSRSSRGSANSSGVGWAILDAGDARSRACSERRISSCAPTSSRTAVCHPLDASCSSTPDATPSTSGTQTIRCGGPLHSLELGQCRAAGVGAPPDMGAARIRREPGRGKCPQRMWAAIRGQPSEVRGVG